ncbi:Rid family hydrolase [Streptomyces sp. NPDC007984]|uniref:Rid family hydrolase n=1 Tax=Streptomyces sp. NPDC007984 TaxID=3364801 RepID=UPI0036E3335B
MAVPDLADRGDPGLTAAPRAGRRLTPAGSRPGYEPNRLIPVSGQLSFDEAGALHPEDDIAAQLGRTYVNLDKVLAHYGATRNQIASQTLYAVDLVRNAEAIDTTLPA